MGMHENELALRIMDGAFEIHRALGPGLLESVYAAILARKLQDAGLAVERQAPIPIRARVEPRNGSSSRCVVAPLREAFIARSPTALRSTPLIGVSFPRGAGQARARAK
jgi:hypothetical protein